MRIERLYPLKRGGDLGIEVFAQVGSIDTGIGSNTLLIERLNELERLLGGESILLVALYLQTRQIEETRGGLYTFLLRHGSNRKRIRRNSCHKRIAIVERGDSIRIFVRLELGSERGRAIGSAQLPICLRHKILDLCLPPDNERKRRRLHPPDRKHLTALPLPMGVADSVRTRGVHT